MQYCFDFYNLQMVVTGCDSLNQVRAQTLTLYFINFGKLMGSSTTGNRPKNFSTFRPKGLRQESY